MIAASVAVSAGVAAFVVVVIAVEIGFDLKRAVDVSFGNFADVTGCSADDLDADITQSVDRSAADASADKNIYSFLCQQCGKGSVAAFPGGKNLFTDNFTVLGFKNSKFRSMTEMLKHLMIFTSHCDFHNFFPLK